MRPNISALACAILLAAAGCKRPLAFDAQGFPHGSGERTFRYHSGAVKLREDYVEGVPVRSRWFKPDGTLIHETDWQHGTGEGLYLRDDGSIRTRMHYVGGVAEGSATEYDSRGNVTKIETYRHGQPVADESKSPNSRQGGSETGP